MPALGKVALDPTNFGCERTHRTTNEHDKPAIPLAVFMLTAFIHTFGSALALPGGPPAVATFRGVVRSELAGEPVAGAQVSVGDDLSVNASLGKGAGTDATGIFYLWAMPVSTSHLVITAEGYVTSVVDLTEMALQRQMSQITGPHRRPSGGSSDRKTGANLYSLPVEGGQVDLGVLYLTPTAGSASTDTVELPPYRHLSMSSATELPPGPKLPARAQPTAGATGDLVQMERFVVEASRPDERPWIYFAGPDFEILSRGESWKTESAAIRMINDMTLQREIVPSEYWSRVATPIAWIVFDRKPNRGTGATLLPNGVSKLVPPEFNWGPSDWKGVELTGGLSVADSDNLSTVVNWWNLGSLVDRRSEDRARSIGIGLDFRLQQCVPALPNWFQAGILGPYGLYHIHPLTQRMLLPAALWISKTTTNAIVKAAGKSKTMPELPPVEGLFRERRLGEAEPSPAWMAEAALFVRWGIFGVQPNEPSHLPAFERFVDRARVEPVTDAMFRECFGFGFAEMQRRLESYLVRAADEPISLAYNSMAMYPPQRPVLKERNATNAEIARILGNWERMEGNSLKANDPDLSRRYLEEAGKTLLGSYAKGERDPRLLAVIGLYEYDLGATTQARGFLEAATQAGVVQPSAYIDLAQLNLAEAEARASASFGRFSFAQTATVLEPLFAARRQSKLTALGYLLMAEAWAHCSEKPLAGNLEAVREGVFYYPRNLSLIYSVAKLHAQWDDNRNAAAVIEQGLKFAEADEAGRFLQLRATLKP